MTETTVITAPANLVHDYVAASDSREADLKLCELAYDALGLMTADGDVSRTKAAEAFGEAVTTEAAQAFGPVGSPEFKVAVTTPRNRPGGAKVAGSAIAQRADAWADVLAAGLTPDLETISASFILASYGNSKARKARDARVAAGEDFTRASYAERDTLAAARAEKRGARRSAAEKGEDEPLTVDAVVALLGLIPGVYADADDEGKASIAAALATAQKAVKASQK